MFFSIHKHTMKRTCILIWIAAILLSACGQAKETTGTETEPGTDTEAVVETEAETETTRMDVDDGLPEADFEDRSYRIVSYDYIMDDYDAEEMNGSLVNDAIYNRNLTVGNDSMSKSSQTAI